jgi:hypothetical protein
MTTGDPESPDRGEYEQALAGVKMDREESLRWLRARDAGKEAVPAHVHDWALRVLGLPAGRRTA